jgi:hypothetical protein
MLTSKALSKKLTATYCTATNSILVHKANIQRKNVYANNAQKIIRNVTQQQLQTFNNLPATYLQNAKAKAFPIKYAAALMQKLFA